MGYTILEKEMEVALRKMLQEMFPEVWLSRTGIAMLAEKIDALEKKRVTMPHRTRVSETRPELN